MTPRELGVSERTFRLEELSESDEDSDEGSVTPPRSPAPVAAPAAAPAAADTAGESLKGALHIRAIVQHMAVVGRRDHARLRPGEPLLVNPK